jgi:hypothetical protein
LVQACVAFYDEYQSLPGGDSPAIDAGEISNNPSMASLIGLLIAMDENPEFQTFSNTKVPTIQKGTTSSASQTSPNSSTHGAMTTTSNPTVGTDFSNRLVSEDAI